MKSYFINLEILLAACLIRKSSSRLILINNTFNHKFHPNIRIDLLLNDFSQQDVSFTIEHCNFLESAYTMERLISDIKSFSSFNNIEIKISATFKNQPFTHLNDSLYKSLIIETIDSEIISEWINNLDINTIYRHPFFKVMGRIFRGGMVDLNKRLDIINTKINSQKSAYLISRLSNGRLSMDDLKDYPDVLNTTEMITDLKTILKI